MPESAVVDIAGGIVIVLVRSGNAMRMFLMAGTIFAPVVHPIGTRMFGSHPGYNHCISLAIALCYVYLSR